MHKSQAVLDQIGRLHLPVQNAQIQWIITRGKVDKYAPISSVDENQLPPGTLTLVDMQNVSFKLSNMALTKSTQMRINGILFDRQPRSSSAACLTRLGQTRQQYDDDLKDERLSAAGKSTLKPDDEDLDRVNELDEQLHILRSRYRMKKTAQANA
jgi:hypothetical protein